MKKFLSFLSALALCCALSACGGQGAGTGASQAPTTPQPTQPPVSTHPLETPEPSTSADVPALSAPVDETAGENHILIAYFAYGENAPLADGVDASTSASIQYRDGIRTGNTGLVAGMIADATGGDLFSILTVEQYPDSYDDIRADIDRTILASTTERDFIHVMTEMGYQFKTHGKSGKPLKYPGLKPPDAGGYFRFHKLGEGYTLEQIRERILQNIRKQVPFPEAEQNPPRRYRVKHRPQKKVSGLRALYFRYCYELHIIVKKPASVKRVSFLLCEDMVKLDRLDAETRFLGKQRIDTIGELTAHRETASAEIDALTAQRQELRKEVRRFMRQGDAIAADEMKQKISAISNRLRLA